ncbi:hypothetical protein J6590_032197 [Homalodisca vitripennis]|nr:hypothetical protein J6590_032197 [Homalodisca vitripennis]
MNFCPSSADDPLRRVLKVHWPSCIIGDFFCTAVLRFVGQAKVRRRLRCASCLGAPWGRVDLGLSLRRPTTDVTMARGATPSRTVFLFPIPK